VTEIQATVDLKDTTTKCKGNLHWVAQPHPGVEPTKVELRLYDRLFLSKVCAAVCCVACGWLLRRVWRCVWQDPGSMDTWLDDINPNSLQTITTAYADAGIADAKAGDKFQFERVGYFNTDPDSNAARLVFNRTVKLKETEKLKA
jgi:glutaminyl-tRNA synthetase